MSLGDELARSGNTGQVEAPHLHYEVLVVWPEGPVPPGNDFLKGGFEVNPEGFLFPEDLTVGGPP